MKYLLLLLCLFLTSCAPMNAKSLVCIGWCAQQEIQKGETPIVVKDLLPEKETKE